MLLNRIRTPSFSCDRKNLRQGGREHWVPVTPGEDDLRPRPQQVSPPSSSDDLVRRSKEDLAR